VITHLIFDLFGTLVRTNADLLGVDAREFWLHGEQTWMKEDVAEQERFASFAQAHGITHEELCKNFSLLEKSARMIPGMLALLRELKEKGYSLHVLSNAGQTTKKVVLSQPAFSVFDTITCSYEIGQIKPHKEAFSAVLKKINARPEECVMIGDNLHSDIRGAQQAGLFAVHFDADEHTLDDLREELRNIGIM